MNTQKIFRCGMDLLTVLILLVVPTLFVRGQSVAEQRASLCAEKLRSLHDLEEQSRKSGELIKRADDVATKFRKAVKALMDGSIRLERVTEALKRTIEQNALLTQKLTQASNQADREDYQERLKVGFLQEDFYRGGVRWIETHGAIPPGGPNASGVLQYFENVRLSELNQYSEITLQISKLSQTIELLKCDTAQLAVSEPTIGPPRVSREIEERFTGEWDTKVGTLASPLIPMSLKQTRNHVDGTYQYRNITGTISGTGNGDTLTYFWSAGGRSGTGVFTISVDGKRISGTYSEKGQEDNVWNGSRKQ